MTGKGIHRSDQISEKSVINLTMFVLFFLVDHDIPLEKFFPGIEEWIPVLAVQLLNEIPDSLFERVGADISSLENVFDAIRKEAVRLSRSGALSAGSITSTDFRRHWNARVKEYNQRRRALDE